ncbi:hypothetical protein BDN71DRAFT_1508774 [Pleurotus eryngii]|uniref:Uncharacterized protein n=1 Tax=Pleurotus eryngii TaxID=5323 RepID=A0A9P5ZWR4_PLEER|nr:hypothetical protein BDN71DRAFT_1508774 [Pleurotus eryngii]
MKAEAFTSPRPSPYATSPHLGRSQPPRPATIHGQELTAKILLSGALDSQVTDSQYIENIISNDSEDWNQSISQPIEDAENTFPNADADDHAALIPSVKEEEVQEVSLTCSLSIAEWDLIKAIRAHAGLRTASLRDQVECMGKEYKRLQIDYKKLSEKYERGKGRNEKLEEMIGDVQFMLNTC